MRFARQNFAFTLLVTYAYRMHIQDGGMHAAFKVKISRFISKAKQDTE
jgi:hypothetical protein